MTDRPIPTADALKRAAMSDELADAIQLATSELLILQALLSAGQAVRTLRDQVTRLTGAQDAAELSILEAHKAAEAALDRLANAAYEVIKEIATNQDRRAKARYN